VLFDVLIAVAGILVNVFGFFMVTRQIRIQALATRGETYTSLCGLSYDILKMIFDHPSLFPYVYEGKRLTKDTPESERVQVLICCEMIANYCDNVVLQRENIPNEIWLRWRAFIREQLLASAELTAFIHHYGAWYSPDLGAIVHETQHA
jgi:hypothetical protein